MATPTDPPPALGHLETPALRLSRSRLTVRGMMLCNAGLALGLFVAQEFQDGLPPRFVVRGIPARIDRLRPEMTWGQTCEVLGLEASWLKGGTDARFLHGDGNGHHMHEVYCVRPPRMVMGMVSVGGGPVKPTGFYRSDAMIQLWFDTDIDAGMAYWRADRATRLVHASFSSSGTIVAKMPGPRSRRSPRP